MNRFTLATGLLTLVAVAPLPEVARAQAEVVSGAATEIQLELGKGRLIRLDQPAATVFIADPTIADIQIMSPTLVYVVGKALGGTSLFAVDPDDRMIANLGLTVGFDEARLGRALAQVSPDADIEIASVNGALMLSGSVGSAAQGEEILRIAADFVGSGENGEARIINRLRVEAANQINLRVRVAEVSRDAKEILGFNWEGVAAIGSGVLGFALGGDVLDAAGDLLRPPGGGGAVGGSVQSGTTNIGAVMDALEERGLVTMLAEPNLTAVSGEPASFLAGGEYPVPVPQGPDQITIEYKRFGVSLAFVATVLEGGRISLNVRPEVSQLSSVGAITMNGISVPALTSRRAETTVELGSGQSFAIAGLLQNTVSEDVSRFPGLGETPIIGPLFRSRRFRDNQSELVIIVTPYLVRPVSQPLVTPRGPREDAGLPDATEADGPAVDSER